MAVVRGGASAAGILPPRYDPAGGGDPIEKYSEEHLQYAQAFILYGCGHTIDLWLNRDCEESPQEIAKLLAAFISRL